MTHVTHEAPGGHQRESACPKSNFTNHLESLVYIDSKSYHHIIAAPMTASLHVECTSAPHSHATVRLSLIPSESF